MFFINHLTCIVNKDFVNFGCDDSEYIMEPRVKKPRKA